jgi:hypothetical protein
MGGRFPLNSTEDVLAVFGKIMPKKFDDVSARVRYICLTGSCLSSVRNIPWRLEKSCAPNTLGRWRVLVMLLIAGRGSVLAFGDLNFRNT